MDAYAHIAINGSRTHRPQCVQSRFFGKIGFSVVAINDLADLKTLCASLCATTRRGQGIPAKRCRGGLIAVDGIRIPVFAEKGPVQAAVEDLDDVVLEVRGVSTDLESASVHLTAALSASSSPRPAKAASRHS